MKRFKLVFPLILCCSLALPLSGCSKAPVSDTPVSDTPKSYTSIDPYADHGCLDYTQNFYSLEEFQDYLASAKRGELVPQGVDEGDTSMLSTLDCYYLPTRVPDGYKLAEVSVDAWNITFNYLPEKYTVSQAMRGVGSNKALNFYVQIFRHDISEDIWQKFIDDLPEELQNSNEKYVSPYDTLPTYVQWKEDEDYISVFCGQNFKENILDYCEVEKIDADLPSASLCGER